MADAPHEDREERLACFSVAYLVGYIEAVADRVLGRAPVFCGAHIRIMMGECERLGLAVVPVNAHAEQSREKMS